MMNRKTRRSGALRGTLAGMAAGMLALAPLAATAQAEVDTIGALDINDVKEIGELWRASRIDETWQEEQWGTDEEAHAQAARKESDFFAAKRFHDLAF